MDGYVDTMRSIMQQVVHSGTGAARTALWRQLRQWSMQYCTSGAGTAR